MHKRNKKTKHVILLLPFPLRHCAGFCLHLRPQLSNPLQLCFFGKLIFLFFGNSSCQLSFRPSALRSFSLWLVLSVEFEAFTCSGNYFSTSFYYISVFNLNAACMSMACQNLVYGQNFVHCATIVMWQFVVK